MSKEIIIFFRYAALAGNILFILWIWYNGINEGFKATAMQLIVFISLTLLLITNSVLLFIKHKEN